MSYKLSAIHTYAYYKECFFTVIQLDIVIGSKYCITKICSQRFVTYLFNRIIRTENKGIIALISKTIMRK